MVPVFTVHLSLTKMIFPLNFPMQLHKASLTFVYYTPIRRSLISEKHVLKIIGSLCAMWSRKQNKIMP